MSEVPPESLLPAAGDDLDTFRALHEVAVAAAGLRDPLAVAQMAVQHAQRLAGVDGAVVFAWDRGAGVLRPIAESDSPFPEPDCRPGQGVVGMAFEECRPIVVDDYRAFPGAIPESLRRGIVSCAAVPLVAGETAVGVLGVWTCLARRFGPTDVRLLSLFAAQTGPALEAARLVEERERQAEVFKTLHEVALASSGVLDPQRLAQLIVDRVGELLGADGVAAFWLDAAAGRLRLLAHRGEAEFGDGTATPGEGMLGRCFETRRPVVVDDYASWPGALEPGHRLGIGGAAAIPLVIHERPVGALLVWTHAPRHYPDSELELLTLLSAQISPALESARLVDDREAQARGMRLLNEVAVAASGQLESRVLARLAVEKAQEMTGAGSASLAWLDEATGMLRVIADSHPLVRPGQEVPPDQGALGAAFRDRVPVVVEDYPAWERSLEWAVSLGDASVMAVPLLVRDRPVGALGVQSSSPRRYSPEDIQLVSLLASVVAPALQAARLHSDLAESEQRFRSLYETIACGVLVQAPGGEVLHANLAAQEILGLSLDEMVDMRPEQLWVALDEAGRPLALSERPSRRAAATASPVRGVTMEVRRPHGIRRWVQVDSVPLLDESGRPVQVVSSFIDVTERRAVEDALRGSEGRFRAIFDSGAMGIARLGLDGTIIEANPAFHRFLDMGDGELDGRPFSECLDPEDLGGVRLAEVLEKRRDQAQAEILYRRSDGQVAWGNTLASLVRDERGVPAFVITMVGDVSDRKAQEAALEHQALHDALTDLPNRTLLHDRLHQALLGAQRDGTSVALLLMDLDRFKEVNDSFGHHLGDQLLQQVAVRLRSDLRESDTVARLGGDEFAMILPGVEDESGAGLAARKILKSLEEPFEVEPEVLHVGGSVGIALYPKHGADTDMLLRRADIAMYVAKRSGTGFALYRTDDDTSSPGRLALLGELRQAVDRGELTLHYQPKVDLRTGRVAGLEALVRWEHPSHGLMFPDQFIPLAEDTGLTGPLGLWVVDAALDQSRRWSAAGLDIPIAVNVSARSLTDARLPETVGWMLERHGVRPALLRVEVTESTLMADPERAMELLTALAEMGVGITIDDFGTGYSSLAYLGRLPADELKIARPFVMDMDTVENARVIVRSIIDLGHSLGLMVVGEGVESAHAMDALAAASCDMVQGFHVSRPLPADSLIEWLRGLAQEAERAE